MTSKVGEYQRIEGARRKKQIFTILYTTEMSVHVYNMVTDVLEKNPTVLNSGLLFFTFALR